MDLLIIFGLSLALAAGLTPLVILASRRLGWVVEPREDRWHQRPTAIYGGVAIYLAFIVSSLILGPAKGLPLVLAGGASAMFLLGLADDIFELKPQVKFLGQLLVAMVAVSLGLNFSIFPWPWLNVPFTVLWLVGVTNAVNILDNMDGLSSGVALVSGGMLAVIGLVRGSPEMGMVAAALAGASAGFLIYNFNPAKIFMGDCGSLMLGFVLAGCTVLGAGGASHLTLSLLIPVGVLVVPLFDTTLVSFQRTSHGRSIAQGGRDHSSHRLVFLGLSEKKAVLLLLAISLASGLLSLALQYVSPLLAAVIIVLAVVVFVFFGVFLAGVKVYEGNDKPARRWLNPALGRLFYYKKQMLQILADLLLFSAAYVSAWLLRYEGQLDTDEMALLTQALPWVLAAKMVSLWLLGVYRGQWRYVSVHAMIQLGKACLLGSLLAVLALVVLFHFQLYPRSVIIIDLVLGFVLVAGCRFLLRIFTESVASNKGVPVLIMGAGDGGEMLLRELRNNPGLPYRPVGFVDDDPAKQGLVIHGIKVLGTREDICDLVGQHRVERVFIAVLSQPGDPFSEVLDICAQCGVECSRIQPIIKL
jgi:UDP-GlcNAc:undecaprenyl-phosphate/decaprenyl-phosphate GlcNAc-1-phosphate transferase